MNIYPHLYAALTSSVFLFQAGSTVLYAYISLVLLATSEYSGQDKSEYEAPVGAVADAAAVKQKSVISALLTLLNHSHFHTLFATLLALPLLQTHSPSTEVHAIYSLSDYISGDVFSR